VKRTQAAHASLVHWICVLGSLPETYPRTSPLIMYQSTLALHTKARPASCPFHRNQSFISVQRTGQHGQKPAAASWIHGFVDFVGRVASVP